MIDDHQYVKYANQLRQYVQMNAEKTLKHPNEYLNYPFVDPGSVYDGNLWDWDSFWAVYALFNLAGDEQGESEKQAKKKARYIKHAKGNVENFFDHQLEDGYIPMMIHEQDKELPEPYLNMKRREGVRMNMHKPFLCQQVVMISGFSGEWEWGIRYIDKLERYFNCYDQDYFHERSGLYVWANDIMIGMDNDPATFGRPNDSTANIYLNSFMVSEMKAMEKLCEQAGRHVLAMKYKHKAETLTDRIVQECWDPRDQFFYSVDIDIKTRAYDWFHEGLGVFWNSLPIKIRTWSGFIPLFAQLATESQAAALAKLHFKDERTFNSPYGITTLAQDEKMFNISATINPSNWLGPIWIVANYVVFRGMMNYGWIDEAKELCYKTVRLLGEDLARTGTLHEYYVPATGRPVMNGGFLNWNMLVVNMIDELEGKRPMCQYWLSSN